MRVLHLKTVIKTDCELMPELDFVESWYPFLMQNITKTKSLLHLKTVIKTECELMPANSTTAGHTLISTETSVMTKSIS